MYQLRREAQAGQKGVQWPKGVTPIDGSRTIRRMPDFQLRRELPHGLPSVGGTISMVNIDPSLLLEEGEFRRQMGWSTQELQAAEALDRVFHLVVGGLLKYPAFYVDFDARGRRQLAAVCQLLGDLPGGSKWQFFTGGKGSLGGTTPLAALREGRLRQVKATAEGFAER